MARPTDLRRRSLALAAGAAGALALGATYASAVRTTTGQALDNASMQWFGSLVQASGWNALPSEVLGLVSPATVLLGTVVVGLVGLLRGPRTAGAAVLTVIGTVLGAQVLKRLLDRPDLLDGVASWGNSLPSGHTAAVAGLTAGLVVALGLAGRLSAWLVAGVLTATAGLATIALQWHRPSDVVASALLAVGVAGLSVALAGRDRSRRRVPQHVTAA